MLPYISQARPSIWGILAIIIALLLLFFICKPVASRRFEFLRTTDTVLLTIKHYLFGLVPVKTECYEDITGFEIQEYQATDSEGEIETKAMTNVLFADGESKRLRRMAGRDSLYFSKRISENLTEFFDGTQDKVVFHKGRIGSFILSHIFAGILGVVTLLVFALGAEKLLKFRLYEANTTYYLKQEGVKTQGLADFPKDIPLIKDVNIDSLNYLKDTNEWQLWMQAPIYASSGEELANFLRTAFINNGWKTSSLEGIPLHIENYDMAKGGAFSFEFKHTDGRVGSVSISKDSPWLVIISVNDSQ